MTVILVVDDQPIFREPIEASLRHRGYEVLSAKSGLDALKRMCDCVPDLILLDMAMPEMDGLVFLRIVRRNPIYRQIPVVLLTAVGERNYVIQAGRLGVHEYLLKSSFSLDEMVVRIEKCLNTQRSVVTSSPAPTPPSAVVCGPAESAESSRPTESARAYSSGRSRRNESPRQSIGQSAAARRQALATLKPVISKDDVIRLVNKGLELRPLAPVVQNVIAATSTASCSADEIAKVVSQDQSLCVRILKLSNRSAYNRGRSVDSVKAAVGRLGSREIRNLVMALGVMQQYEGDVARYIDARMFWEHSIACGIIASAIAAADGHESPEEYFLWGLLHDMGRLILAEHIPDHYAHVVETADSLQLPLELVEAKLLVVDHCTILERALEHWGFSREFIAPVVNHHRSVDVIRRLGPAHMKAAAIIALSNRIAHSLILGSSGNDVLSSVADLCDLVGVQLESLAQIVETVEEQTNDCKIRLLMRAESTAWPDRLADLRARLPEDLHILYLSRQTEFDCFGHFLGRISSPASTERPNMAVLYVPDSRFQPEVFCQLVAREADLGTGILPTLVVCDRGELDEAPLASRRHEVRRSPVRVDDAIRSIQHLCKGPGSGDRKEQLV